MKDLPAHHDVSVDTLLGQVADEFTGRLDRGERPDVEAYAQAHPEIAAILRQVLPALCAVRDKDAGAPGPAEGPGVAPAGTPAAECLGDYRILREIGRGGMGVVYEAIQLSLGRRVALKTLPFAAVLDPRQLQRFRNEAQAAAQLHHSHIVPVFSVGCERGVHYFAMQYIEGHPLSAVITELRELAGMESATRDTSAPPMSRVTSSFPGDRRASMTPTNAASSAIHLCHVDDTTPGPSATIPSQGSTRSRAFFQAVVRLGIQAADALQHAHERGIIHRDIKPSNLLVDVNGHLWVTDFGLALVQTQVGLTISGDLLGTLRYMSPERALAKRVPVDHRTDVYSLGVTLYELLALQPAYPGKDRQELLRQIAFEEPRSLRRINRAIPREIDTIVAKAMAKKPDERYDTVQELGEDLRRFLEDKPIQARPPTVLDRAAKWSRRHRAAVAATVFTLAAAVVGLSVSTVLIVREQAKALHQRDEARLQKHRAQTGLQQAFEAIDRMLTHVATQEPATVLGADRLKRALLEDSLTFQETFIVDEGADENARRDAGRAHIRAGQIHALLGRHERAEQAYRRAIEASEKLVLERPESAEYVELLADGHVYLATLLWEQRRPADAESPARRALNLLQSLTAGHPDTARYRPALADSLNLLGLVLRHLGRHQEAESSLWQAVFVRENLAATFPQQTDYWVELARTHRNLAGLLIKTGRRSEAERSVEEAIRVQEKLAADFPDQERLKIDLAQTRRWWDAVLDLDKRGRAFAVEDESTVLLEETSLQTYRSFASLLKRTAQSKEQEDQAYHQAVALQEERIRRSPHLPKHRLELIATHRAWAAQMKGAWRIQEAEAAYREAVRLLEKLALDSPEQAEYRDQLRATRAELAEMQQRDSMGDLVAQAKRSPEGVGQAVARIHELDLHTVPQNPLVLLICGEYLTLGGHPQRGVEAIRQAIAAGGKLAWYHKSLGWALVACGRREEANAAFRDAMADVSNLTPESLARECPDVWTAAYFLDVVTEEQFTRQWKESRSCMGRFGSLPWFYVGVRKETEGRLEEARSAYRRCAEFARLPDAHQTAYWGAYRLGKLSDQHEVAGR